MSGYIKYFENGGKNMSFLIKNDRVLDKYNTIWDKIKETLNIKFHSMQIQIKKIKMSKFINTQLESKSESELESDTESKSELGSDCE